MKKVILFVLSLVSLCAMAQETYQNAALATNKLDGTARYVAMGGAMEALGADISTINTNPAGVGLFRKSQVSVSAGFLSQTDAGSYKYGDATHASFDQAGFVWSIPTRKNRFLNLAFNYTKGRDFNNVTSVTGSLSGASQNKNAYMNLLSAMSSGGSAWSESFNVSMLDNLYLMTFNGDQDGNLYYNEGSRYTHDFSSEGYVGCYDINISGKVGSRVYLGLTFGFEDVNYRSHSTYTEQLVDNSEASVGSITVSDHRTIDGTGFNLKAGIIFFPVESFPLRIGAYIATPTWYDLTSRSWTSLTNNTTIAGAQPIDPSYDAYGEYNYRVYTPWQFGVSLGYTVGTRVAIGASYEYADYSSMSSRYINGYDYYYFSGSMKDRDMNDHTQKTLKGVSTVKVGVEVKVTNDLALRMGYNYVSSMYREDGSRDGSVESLGTYYSSRADYTNWQDTHRVTAGIGYTIGRFTIDLAYQYNLTKGTYFPFAANTTTYYYDDGTKEKLTNAAQGVDIKDKHHQFLATLAYKF